MSLLASIATIVVPIVDFRYKTVLAVKVTLELLVVMLDLMYSGWDHACCDVRSHVFRLGSRLL